MNMRLLEVGRLVDSLNLDASLDDQLTHWKGRVPCMRKPRKVLSSCNLHA